MFRKLVESFRIDSKEMNIDEAQANVFKITRDVELPYNIEEIFNNPHCEDKSI